MTLPVYKPNDLRFRFKWASHSCRFEESRKEPQGAHEEVVLKGAERESWWTKQAVARK